MIISKCNAPLVLALVGICLAGAPTTAYSLVPPVPSVTHVPTTAGSVPFGSNDSNVANLAAFGYVQEEFFISSIVGGQAYTTRILVRRPADPKRFSGIVIVESIHPLVGDPQHVGY
jgi:hypothetical protein